MWKEFKKRKNASVDLRLHINCKALKNRGEAKYVLLCVFFFFLSFLKGRTKSVEERLVEMHVEKAPTYSSWYFWAMSPNIIVIEKFLLASNAFITEAKTFKYT